MNRSASRVLPLLALLTTAGCEPLPDEPIYAYGQALRADGSPLSGAVMPLTRTLDKGTLLLDEEGRILAPEFSEYTTLTTEEDGSFIAEALIGDLDKQGPNYSVEPYRFRIIPPPEDGHAVILSFIMYLGSDVELPPLQPWAANLSWVDGAVGTALAFAPPPPVPELPRAAKYPMLVRDGEPPQPLEPLPPEPVLQLLSEGTVLWQEVGARSPWSPRPWLLEDFARPEAVLRATTSGDWSFSPLAADDQSMEFRLEWRTERLAVPAGALRPISRGATCLNVEEGPCPWTDGELQPLRVSTAQQVSKDVVVALAAPIRLSRAVIRGLQVLSPFDEWSLRLEGSEDGVTWSPLAEAVGFPAEEPGRQFRGSTWAADSPFDPPLVLRNRTLFLDIPLQGATPVLQVRLSAQDANGRPLTISQLAELSVFE